MPTRPEPVVFAIGPEIDDKRLARWLPGLAPAGPSRVSDRVLFDTFDGRLARKDMVLWRRFGRGGGSFELEGHPGALTVEGPDRPFLGADLPAGAIGDRLRDAIAERALLPRVRVRSRFTPLKLCDGEGKTVVRLLIDEPEVLERGRTPVVLERRLHVQPVLGYDRELERALSSLRHRLAECEGTLPAEALRSVGLEPDGQTSNVDVRLKPSMRADRATSMICRRLADVVDANLQGTIDDTDPEFLHDLRVAVRRSRSVLKEMRNVLPPSETGTARADLRWIQEITGPTRDLDVLLMSWPEMVEPVPPRMAGDLQPLVDLLHRERTDAFTAMRRHLRSRRFADAWQRWKATVSESAFDGSDSGRAIGELAGGRIVAVYKGMVKMGSAIDDSSPPEALHDLRKKGKELRYLLELFGSMWPSDRVKPLVGALKGLQDVLGHFQDDEIQVHELRSLGPILAGTPGGTDSLIALGFVVEGLARRQQHARDDFARRFADFAAPDNRKLVSSTFAVRVAS
ncbi:MAG TPA: CHAD domain-containing protein [Acidimicrobiales bacterium]|nr:CHAD domain-containing protein [Acidimicrobiales bacterium]